MTRVFVLGATGFVGGDALGVLIRAHPEYEYTVLVRDEERGKAVQAQMPNVGLVYGDLDDLGLLTEEASKSDIILNWASSDHENAVEAILKGLSQKSSSNPGFLIQTSGTGLLLHDDIAAGRWSASSDKVYDDWDNMGELLEFPDAAFHRVVDKMVLAADNGSSVRTLIVCPPAIYGQGRGPGNRRSHQVPWLARLTLKQKHGILAGEGKARWCGIHVHDLSNLYLLLIEQAALGGGKATWGEQRGYYFAESEEFVWGDVAREIAKVAFEKGYTETADVKVYTQEQLDELLFWGGSVWSFNSRSRAIRARKLLGWEPKAACLKDWLPEAIEIEFQSLAEPARALGASGSILVE